jgi:hypothetical protein
LSLLDSINLRQSSAQALRSGRALETKDADRVCDEPSCTTRLSRYNPAASCSMHEGWEDPVPNRRGPAKRRSR